MYVCCPCLYIYILLFTDFQSYRGIRKGTFAIFRGVRSNFALVRRSIATISCVHSSAIMWTLMSLLNNTNRYMPSSQVHLLGISYYNWLHVFRIKQILLYSKITRPLGIKMDIFGSKFTKNTIREL